MTRATLRGLRSDAATLLGLPLWEATSSLALQPEARLLADVARLGADLPTERTGPRILFVSLKPSWTGNVAYESVLALALSLRGADCSFLLQGEALPMCDQRWYRHTAPTRARVIEMWAGALERHLPFPVHRLESFADHSGAEPDHISDLGPIITPSMRRFYRRAHLPGDARGTRLRRAFLGAARTLATTLPRALDAYLPKAVVTVNGSFFGERLLLDLCREREIPIYTYEPGFMRHTLQFRLDGAATNRDCPAAWAAVQDNPLTEAQRASVRAVLADRCRGASTALTHRPRADEAAVRRTAGIRAGRPHVSLFTNVVWDVAVQDRAIAFRDLYDWIDTTVSFFRDRPEGGLTLRIHPAEVTSRAGRTVEPVADHLAARFATLPDNVTLVPPEAPLNAYQLVEHSDAVLAYTSTIGLEAALMGRPTVVAAKTHYRGKGFTLDPSTPEAYLDLLGHAASGTLPTPDDPDAAWRYAYAFFGLAHIPFPFLGTSEPGRFRGIDVPDLGSLAPGQYAGLDAICDAILEGREPLAPEASAPTAS
ncbi:hypothetical protein [Rubrivirga sp. IMCC43871]|uniref:capsular polysaccharide export protein, LipB/KpsS family n=1 Tax=Rubrivirga sp. IMCC43871 TaxID=3391575 RepID=UPI00398FE67E